MTPRLLHLMHLVSPALPIGAYAYSQGLEWAIENGWIKPCERGGQPEALVDWLSALLEKGLGHLDLPILSRCMDAWTTNDFDALDCWNDYLRACRETSELLLEDEQLGMALARLLGDLGVAEAARPLSAKPGYALQFALACHHWGIPKDEALAGFAFSWLENQVAAATKLVPLGQTQAQKLLMRLMPEIPPVCERALVLEDDELGLSLPGLAYVSARHERQYSRLFRS